MTKVNDEVGTMIKEGGKPKKNDKEARMKALREKSKRKKEQSALPPIKKG